MRLDAYDEDDQAILGGRDRTILTPEETKRYWQDLADLREPIERESDDYPGALSDYRGRRFPADQDAFEDDWN